jgi:serine/threonine-protein kinase RsbW
MTSREGNNKPHATGRIEPDSLAFECSNDPPPAQGLLRTPGITNRTLQVSANEYATQIPSDLAEVCRIQEEVERLLSTHGYDKRDVFAIRLAVGEALVNAVKHGNHMDRNKQVCIAYRVTSRQFEMIIADEGAGFKLPEVANPLACENHQHPCGRGLYLMRFYMTTVLVYPPGNKLYLHKISSKSQATDLPDQKTKPNSGAGFGTPQP